MYIDNNLTWPKLEDRDSVNGIESIKTVSRDVIDINKYDLWNPNNYT